MRSALAPASLDDPFVCTPIPGGHTWTPTTRLGELLREAEALYGPRDLSWTILGVEFGAVHEQPNVWFPGRTVAAMVSDLRSDTQVDSRACKHIAIQLTLSARSDPAQLVFQLAHEVVHLLSPTGAASSLLIEEGLATVFTEDAVAQRFPDDRRVASHPVYKLAALHARAFLADEPRRVAMMRALRPSFQTWDAAFVQSFAPHLDADTAQQLCTPFARFTG